jgi:hypothetical protein
LYSFTILGLSKPEFNLTNDDIRGSKPAFNKFRTKRQPSNPLEPKYNLPKVEYMAPEVPKFIRDSINIKDIDGAGPRKIKFYETRNIMKIGDIEGSSPHKRRERRSLPRYNYLDYSDVQKVEEFTSTRHTNPLQPTYKHRNDKDEVIKIGEIEKSSPSVFMPRKTPVDYNP